MQVMIELFLYFPSCFHDKFLVVDEAREDHYNLLGHLFSVFQEIQIEFNQSSSSAVNADQDPPAMLVCVFGGT